jgi:hypothetical protein
VEIREGDIAVALFAIIFAELIGLICAQAKRKVDDQLSLSQRQQP